MNNNKRDKKQWIRDAIKSQNKPIDVQKAYDSILEKSESNNFDCMYYFTYYFILSLFAILITTIIT